VRSTSSRDIPSMATRFRRPLAPATTAIAEDGIPNAPANNRVSASLAEPSTGGAATRTFTASPCQPTISERLARGWTWTVRRVCGDTLHRGRGNGKGGKIDPARGTIPRSPFPISLHAVSRAYHTHQSGHSAPRIRFRTRTINSHATNGVMSNIPNCGTKRRSGRMIQSVSR
jgi:hypothetical protein